MFVIYVEAIIYLLFYNLHDCTFNNITKEEREVLYNLKYDPRIIIKSANQHSVVVVWNREGYLKEVYRQPSDKKMYEQVSNNSNDLANTL